MVKIFGNWFKGIKGVQLCACSHFSGYTTNLFTCRLTYLAPFARAQFLVKLGGFRLTYFFLAISFFLLKLGGFRLTYFFLAISFFLLLLLLTICFFFHMLYQILTKLGQNDQWVTNYKSYQQFDLKGHVGVTGVKKVIFTENATPPTCFIGF